MSPAADTALFFFFNPALGTQEFLKNVTQNFIPTPVTNLRWSITWWGRIQGAASERCAQQTKKRGRGRAINAEHQNFFRGHSCSEVLGKKERLLFGPCNENVTGNQLMIYRLRKIAEPHRNLDPQDALIIIIIIIIIMVSPLFLHSTCAVFLL